jgi:photosystem II stability/assembly factor-like uncharacterized protein
LQAAEGGLYMVNLTTLKSTQVQLPDATHEYGTRQDILGINNGSGGAFLTRDETDLGMYYLSTDGTLTPAGASADLFSVAPNLVDWLAIQDNIRLFAAGSSQPRVFDLPAGMKSGHIGRIIWRPDASGIFLVNGSRQVYALDFSSGLSTLVGSSLPDTMPEIFFWIRTASGITIPTGTPEPAGPAHLPSGSRIQLDQIHMASQTEGWGIAGGYLLVTGDGGRTWREVTPGAYQADQIYGAFLDEKTAWIIFSHTGQIDDPLTIHFTTDGGSTWSSNQGQPMTTNVFGDTTWAEFSVLDGRNVWVMLRGVYLGAGTHYNHAIFHTSDGGLNWTSLYSELSDDYTGMVFADTSLGLRTLQTTGAYGPGAPAYDTTTDGGATWVSHELPAPLDAPGLFDQYPYCESYQPVLLSAKSVHLLVGCFDYSNPPVQFSSYLYSSSDGGGSWTTVKLPDKVLASQDTLFYFDASRALLLGREIYQSADGGQTWSYVQTVNWDGQFSFVDSQNGWAVVRANGEVGLVQTTNGGKSWSEIKPTIK